MKKSKAYIFTDTTCRILVNPENMDELEKADNVAIDAGIAHLKGIPPHLWKLNEGMIEEMSPEEKAQRLSAIKHNISDNRLVILHKRVEVPVIVAAQPEPISEPIIVPPAKPVKWKVYALFAVLVVLLAILAIVGQSHGFTK